MFNDITTILLRPKLFKEAVQFFVDRYRDMEISVVVEERSQLANKTKALCRLKEKLLVIVVEQRAAEIKQIRCDVMKAEWGQQIRYYMFHPYKLVKDVRIGHETTDIASVMDGDLEPFIKTYLKHKYAAGFGERSVFSEPPAALGILKGDSRPKANMFFWNCN